LWMEVIIASVLFLPIWDTTKRNFALWMSKQSFLPTLKYGIYIVGIFLLFILFTSWKESGILGDSRQNLLEKARAEYDFSLAFSTLVLGPLMWRYFAVMSEMRRLEKSDIALAKQANQASNMVKTLMDENKKLQETNKKWEELSFKKVSLSSGATDLKKDNESNNEAFKRQKVVLEEKNKDLERELEETKKSIEMLKKASIEEATRQAAQQESLQRELEGYKLMVFKSKVS